MTRSILAMAVIGVGCVTPTAPSPIEGVTPIVQQTSRVDPATVDLSRVTLEHDPMAPGVSLCRTQPRMYCAGDDIDATCEWEVDLYTVILPETCPTEPIE